MTDDELGKGYYNYTSRGWPAPVGWDNLSAAAKKLWIARAKKAIEKDKSG
jgi:hypothetical protein